MNYQLAKVHTLEQLGVSIAEAEKDGYVPHGSLIYTGVYFIQALVKSTKRLDIATQIAAGLLTHNINTTDDARLIAKSYRIADQLLEHNK